MKNRLVSIICTLALFSGTIPAHSQTLSAFEQLANGYIEISGNRYEVADGAENLFANGDFSGSDLSDWYTGTSSTEAGSYTDISKAPVPPMDGASAQNLIPLSGNTLGKFSVSSGVLTESVGATGDNEYQGAVWYGGKALLSYVEIEPGKTYYFTFDETVSNSGMASIRYGAINADISSDGFYAPTSSAVNWASDTCFTCTEFDMQTLGTVGSTASHGLLFTADDDATHFFFNAYWLQVSYNMSFDNFALYEIDYTPAGDTRTFYYAMDSSDSGITFTGSKSYVLGQVGNATDFTGGYATLTQFPLTDTFTITAWVNPSSGTSWQRIFDFGSDTNNYIFLTNACDTGYPRLAVKTNGGQEQYLTSNKLLPTGEWSHIAVTLASTSAKMYINGELCAEGNITSPPSLLSQSSGNYIAKSQYPADPVFTGIIDEVEIFNYAKTQTEIRSAMSETAAEVVSVSKPDITVKLGDSPILPSTVTVTYENSMTASAAVTWESTPEYTQSGKYTLNGYITVGGKTIPVVAEITVTSDSINEFYSVSQKLCYANSGSSPFLTGSILATSEKDENLIAIIAVYDSNGKLIDVNHTPVEDDSESFLVKTLSRTYADTGCTAKIMLWNGETLMPITNPLSRNINSSTSGGFSDTALIALEKDSLFEKSEQVGLEYILSIDVDRLLAPSYEMHGLPAPNNAERYDGWERKGANNWTSSSSETYTLAGHSLGHWMSAAAVFYRDTGNEEVKELLDYAVDRLDELQEKTGSAYIGGCEEATFTKLFNGDSGWVDGYWVPWYGIHKIYQGLVDSYYYTENPTALKVLTKFCDWAVEGTASLSDSQMQSMLNVEYGGMNEIFALMYEITGEDKYLTAARRFTHDSILNPLAEGTDSLAGLHANTQIPKIVGAAELYEQDPEKYASYKTACENFWDFVVNNRSYAIGGNSIAEHFEAQGAETLGIKTCESCNTYNMLRLTEHLFSWNHDSAYMDYYENALYNHLLGQQDPDTGAKMYFVSLLQGHHRIYEEKYNSWWCCTGTGMENPGRYTRCVYYEDNNDLYVNLYMPNTYTWAEKGLTLKLETSYPYSDKVKITVVDGSCDATINLRAPSWLTSEMTAVVGDNSYTSEGGKYLAIERTWQTGDVIDITIPLEVRTYYSRIDGQIAYLYGPLALAAKLDPVEGVDGVDEYVSNETKLDSVTVDVPYIITNGNAPESLVTIADSEALIFTISGENSSDGNSILLEPFHGIHHHFHNVYWNLDQGADEYEKALNDVTIDRVEPDGQQDEIGHLLLSSDSHQGSFVSGIRTYYWRDAYGSEDAYFSYTMSVDSESTNYLFVRYWGSDGDFGANGITYKRSFNIYADGTLVGTQTLNAESPNSPYDVFYTIPAQITEGKDSVTVKFVPADTSSCAGGYLEMRTTSATVEE